MDITEFADTQSAAVERAATLIRERLDLTAIMQEAGVDLTDASTVTVEFDTGVTVEDGLAVLRKGDGKGRAP